MAKNRGAKMLTGMETVALSSLSDYINNLDTEALAELRKNTCGKIRKTVEREGEEVVQNIRHHMDD